MALENYCKHCGHRILPNETICEGCGSRTGYSSNGYESIFEFPVHNIGFFNFSIDFSPYINTKQKDFKYEICSCGYINDVENEFCYMCGAKRSQSKLKKILKHKQKPKFSIGNVLCECGTVNPKENVYCEMCGRQLHDDEKVSYDNYSNFNLEYEDPIFCFCGEENEKYSRFCKNCGLPLDNYGKSSDLRILCTCSTLNEITSDFCVGCGENLKKEDFATVCICGELNKHSLKFCQSCGRPLNPKRNIQTRIVCTCGSVLDWDSDFCPNCGKNIKQTIKLKNSINHTVKNIRGIFR